MAEPPGDKSLRRQASRAWEREPEVFGVLLSVFDEGRLTDRYGRTTILRSAVIILTSHLGADKLGAVGFGKSPVPSRRSPAS